MMSELSTVRCDRALGLLIAGTRASSVDGELPWRSSGRATAVASTPGSRAQAATEDGFLRLLKIRGLKVCLRVFWTTPVRPVGETDQTGQSGFELPDRSDRSSAPVRPVCVCCAAVRKVSLAFASALRPGFSASR